MAWKRRTNRLLAGSATIIGIPGMYGDTQMWWRLLKHVGMGIETVTDYLEFAPLILVASLIYLAVFEGHALVRWLFRRRVIPMTGHAEVEHCQQVLIKYLAIPSQRMLGSAHIAGSLELYPYMTELCRVLDDQGIPHPEIDYHLEIVDTGVWSRFLGDLWAVRHDIKRARRVYSGSRP